MRAARGWLYAAVLASFGAGVSVGVIIPGLLRGSAEGQAQDSTEDYIRQLTELCDLDVEQVRDLRMILIQHERELRELRRNYFDQFPKIYREKYDMAGKRMDTRIRGIMDVKQRQDYLAKTEQTNK